MNAIVLPEDLQAWAEAEVAAGAAPTVEAFTAAVLADYRRQKEAFLQSLDDAVADADRNGWLDADDVFAEVRARLDAGAAQRRSSNG